MLSRLVATAFALALILLGAAAPAPALAQNQETVVYVNGRWWDAGRFRARTVYVRDGRFVRRPRGGADSEVDLTGGYVTPAFAEAHHHRICDAEANSRFIDAGVVYVGVMNARVSSRACEGRLHGADGVEAMNALAGLTAHNAHPSQIGLYFLREDQIDGEWLHYVDAAADLDRVWPRIAAEPPDMVKIILGYSEDYARLRDDESMPPWYRGLDPALVPEIVRRGHAGGLRVAAHVLSAHDFDVAVAADVDVIAHMPGFAPGAAFTPEEPPHPWLTALLDQPERYLITAASARQAARRGVAVMTTMSGVEEAPSPVPAAYGQFVALQERVTAANAERLRRAGVTLLIGSDRYDFTSVDEALYLVRKRVFTPAQALQSLAVDTPLALFPSRGLGSLRPDAEASFIVFSDDPLTDFTTVRAPRMVVKLGRTLRPV